jgi:hypothetical protein
MSMVTTAVRWLTVVIVVTTVTGAAVAGCGRSTMPRHPACCAAPISTEVPEGWKSETYGEATISVLDNWAVEHGTNCPDGQAPGTLLLGFPTVLQHCPALPASISFVVVATLRPSESHRARPGPLVPRIDGVPVYRSSRYTGSYDWAVPSLGVEVSGTGQDAERILYTLRRS